MIAKRKVQGGKLLIVDAQIDGKRIKRLSITGDFFIHPEESISSIEGFFSTIYLPFDRVNINDSFDKTFKDIKIIGFSCSDVLDLIEEISMQGVKS